MPRIYDSANDPHDFCRACFPDEDSAKELFANLGDGPDGRGNCYGYDAEHPPYSDEAELGSEHAYRCEKCRRPLTYRDDVA
jgi:hypothetical protein